MERVPSALEGQSALRLHTEGRSLDRTLTARARVLCGASVLAATTLAALQVPSLSILPASTALLLPACATFVALGMGVEAACVRQFARRSASPEMREVLVRLLVLSLFGVVLLACGGFASNVLLIHEPFARETLVWYGVTVVATVAILALGWAFLRKRRLTSAVHWRTLLAASLLAAGVILAVLDVLFLPALYHKLHLVIGGAASLSLSLGAFVAFRHRPDACGKLVLPTSLALLVIGTAGYLMGYPTTATLLRESNAARRALLLARQALDGDGDGYSRFLQGGDCDDGDPRAYPLSIIGRDCLEWVGSDPGEGRENGAVAVVGPSSATRPTVVLLITVDAFRCGFGNADREELRNACPELTKLARSGRFLPNAHTPHPDTRAAINSIMRVQRGSWEPDAPFLPTVLANLGYRSYAVMTHPRPLAVKGLREAFDAVDMTLSGQATSAGGITSELVTDRILSIAAT
ncbi:MAG TPA: hypothetical protein VIM73_07905, partial [Polyangiaceae bacterium]